jgi:hypothetical protein
MVSGVLVMTAGHDEFTPNHYTSDVNMINTPLTITPLRR